MPHLTIDVSDSPVANQEIKAFLENDLLDRHSIPARPSNDFFQSWEKTVRLHSNSRLEGITQLILRKIVALETSNDPSYEHYCQVNIIHFPFLSRESGEFAPNFRERLLLAGLQWITENGPFLPTLCFLPRFSAGPNNSSRKALRNCGFELSGDTCSDRELLSALGLTHSAHDSSALVFVYEPTAHCGALERKTNSFEFSNVFGEDPKDRRVFVSKQPEPTAEFWEGLAGYTNMSAYPIMESYLEGVLQAVGGKMPERVLVAPCGPGDILRFWPRKALHRLTEAVAVDVREEMLQLGSTRLRHPDIDAFNFGFSFLLSDVAKRNRLSKSTSTLLKVYNDFLQSVCKVDGQPCPILDEDLVRQISRTFADLVRNHAIPDWFFPAKTLAGLGGVASAIRMKNAMAWLEDHLATIRDSVFKIQQWFENHPNLGISSLNLGGIPLEKCYFVLDDLTDPKKRDQSTYDMIICWEFVHMLDQESLETFLARLLGAVGPSGALVVTGFRQRSNRVPPDLQASKSVLESIDGSIDIITINMEHKKTSAPFNANTGYSFPFLIAKRGAN